MEKKLKSKRNQDNYEGEVFYIEDFRDQVENDIEDFSKEERVEIKKFFKKVMKSINFMDKDLLNLI